MKMLILGIDKDNGVAVSNIMTNIFTSFLERNKDIRITSVGWGPLDSYEILSERFDSFLFDNPLKTFRSKVVRKIQRSLRFDNPFSSWKTFFKRVEKNINCNEYDVIIGAGGFFLYIKTAYELAIKYNKKFVPFYFDPFTKNFLTTNEKKRRKEEYKWCSLAKHIFYDADATKPEFPQFETKMSGFYIPIFEKKSNILKTNKIVYGGVFYRGFREPSVIEDFLNKNSNLEYEFHIYSNLHNIHTNNKNVFLHKIASKEEYEKVCCEAKAILVIGNGSKTNIFPSKLIEAFSFKKPIIGINFSALPPHLLKYPLFINGEGSNIFDALEKIYKESAFDIDLFRIFPERNPDIILGDITYFLVK